MKFLLLAAFVTICTASTLYGRGRSIVVNEDGTILINGAYGKRVVIGREIGLNGQRNIDIVVTGPNFPSRRIQIQDLGFGGLLQGNTLGGVLGTGNTLDVLAAGGVGVQTQGDILFQILREYQGAVDQIQYEKLLTRVAQLVQNGQINQTVYDLLQNLNIEAPLVLSEIQNQIVNGGLGQTGLSGLSGVGVVGGAGIASLPWLATRQQQVYPVGVQGVQGVQGVITNSQLAGINNVIEAIQTAQALNELAQEVGQQQQQGFGSGLNALAYGQGWGSSRYINPLLAIAQQQQQQQIVNNWVAQQQQGWGGLVGAGLQGGLVGGIGSGYATVPLGQSGILGGRGGQSYLLNTLIGQSPVIRRTQIGGGASQLVVGGQQVPLYGGVGLNKEGYGYGLGQPIVLQGQQGYLTPGVQQVVY